MRSGPKHLSKNPGKLDATARNHYQSSSIHAEDSHSYLLEKNNLSPKPPFSMALTPSVVTRPENQEELIRSETNMNSHICLTSHQARSNDKSAYNISDMTYTLIRAQSQFNQEPHQENARGAIEISPGNPEIGFRLDLTKKQLISNLIERKLMDSRRSTKRSASKETNPRSPKKTDRTSVSKQGQRQNQ